MKPSRWFVAAGLTLALVATAYAQRFGEAVEVTVVEVPVTVVDRAGNPVRDLTKEDFEVYDDGKRVPIDYFEVVDMAKISAAAASSKSAPSLPPVATRNFLLLFDLANSSPGTIARATEAAKDFVNDQMGDRDLAAVGVFTAESGAKMLTSFTRNRPLLTSAIHTLGHPRYFKLTDPLMISAVTSIEGGETGGGLAGDSGPNRSASIDAAIADMIAEQNRVAEVAYNTEAKNRLRIQTTQFATVARTLDRLAGQKQVILFSEGFDARLVQGRENLSFEATRQESDQVFSGEAYKVDSDKRFGSAASSRDIAEMGDIFRRSDVVLHAIDIKGLRAASGDASTAGGLRGRSNESLFLFTTPTGGTVFKNENDLRTNMTNMLKQQEVVYVLGFTARSTGKPGKFHELRVKPKSGRASHRLGYFEATGKTTELERTLTLAEILMTDRPVREVEVSLAATPLPGPGGKSRVPVVVEIPGSRLLEGVSGNAATANLYLYVFDEKNQVADFLQQRISLDLAKAGDTIRKGGVRYFGTLRVPPGDYAVKALVRVDESGRSGFYRSDLHVPAFDTATILPPVMFIDPANWVMLVGPARGDDYAYPFAAGEARYIPQRPGAVRNDNEYKLALFLYRVPLEELQVTPALVSNGATSTPDVKLMGRTSADERGGVKLLFNFKPAGLAAGEHELRFTVKAKDGTESVVTLPFRVL